MVGEKERRTAKFEEKLSDDGYNKGTMGIKPYAKYPGSHLYKRNCKCTQSVKHEHKYSRNLEESERIGEFKI